MDIPNKCLIYFLLLYKNAKKSLLTYFVVYLGRDSAMGSVSDAVEAGNISHVLRWNLQLRHFSNIYLVLRIFGSLVLGSVECGQPCV